MSLFFASPAQPIYDTQDALKTDWCWCRLADLPPPDSERYAKGDDAYDSILAGEPVRKMLGALRDEFIVPLSFG